MKSVVLLLVRAEDPVNYGVLDVFFTPCFPFESQKNIVKYMCFSCSPSLCNIKSSAPILPWKNQRKRVAHFLKRSGNLFFRSYRLRLATPLSLYSHWPHRRFCEAYQCIYIYRFKYTRQEILPIGMDSRTL